MANWSARAVYSNARRTSWRESFSGKEKRIWVTREEEIKAKGNSRKRARLIQRKNENWKKKRRINKCPCGDGADYPVYRSGSVRASAFAATGGHPWFAMILVSVGNNGETTVYCFSLAICCVLGNAICHGWVKQRNNWHPVKVQGWLEKRAKKAS